MANNEEARVKLTNKQQNKLNSAAKDNTGTTLRITKKNFQDKELPHKLFLVKKTIKKSKLRNDFANNISTYIKISKAQLSKIILSGGCFGNMIANLDKKSTKRPCHYFS